uniref:C2H2-type domain-containing protein n=1 Tax=Haemonchus contortus TaxID=6289 RepID=A0A7I4YCI4_HAECO
MRTRAQCHICLKGPFVLGNLYRHMEVVHDCSPEEINQTKASIRDALNESRGPFQCDKCIRSYSSRKTLRRHMRDVHHDKLRTKKELYKRSKEEFQRLGGIVSELMETSRALMRGRRYEEMRAMNDDLLHLCKSLPQVSYEICNGHEHEVREHELSPSLEPDQAPYGKIMSSTQANSSDVEFQGEPLKWTPLEEARHS